MKDKVKVQNIFAAVFDKKVLDPLLEYFGGSRKGLSLQKRTVLNGWYVKDSPHTKRGQKGQLPPVKFWGTEGTIDYIKSMGFKGESVIKGFDYSGRVKSLDRANFVRILADTSKKRHSIQLKRDKLEPLNLVVVDLYAPDPKIFPESMDIGGMSLIRSAIKNYNNVALAWDKKSIADLVKKLKSNGGLTTLAFRKKQAKAASKFIAQRTKLEAFMFEKV